MTSWLGWDIEVKKALVDKIKEIISIIYFIYKFSHSNIDRGTELLIDPLAKINIFFYAS